MNYYHTMKFLASKLKVFQSCSYVSSKATIQFDCPPLRVPHPLGKIVIAMTFRLATSVQNLRFLASNLTDLWSSFSLAHICTSKATPL